MYHLKRIVRLLEGIYTQNKEFIISKLTKRRDFVIENTFINVDEVANEIDISKSYVYKIVQRINDELKVKLFITI